jgi:hypothetical protein
VSEPRKNVHVDDPELSPEANRLLTQELRAALGTDHVDLSPEEERERHVHELPEPDRSGLGALLGANRMLVAVTFVALVIVGAIVSLTTGSWWAVVAACAVHASGTLLIGSLVLRLTTAVEHADPDIAAQLREEGVGDPDQAISDLVERFTPGDADRGAAEVVQGGNNRVTDMPDEDKTRATGQQRTAQTPTSHPTEPSGTGGLPAVIPVVAVAASLVVGIGAAIAEGGIAWIGALLLLVASLGWLFLARHIAAAADGESRRAPIVVTLALVVAAVVAGVVIVGALGDFL